MTAPVCCPYCRSSAHLHVTARDFNRRVSDVEFHLCRCEVCGLLFINDPPDNLEHYYPTDYQFVPESADDLNSQLSAQRYKIDIVKRAIAGGRLLEIGASNGMFCRLAQQAGFEVTAVEMDEGCVRFLRDKLGVRTIASTDPAAVLAADETTYEAICLWHTIEHLREPWEVLARAVQRIEPGGVLVIAAPNPDAWQARLLGARWPHHDMPRHLFALPIPWLTAFGRDHGLIIEMVTTRDQGSLYWNRFTWAMLLRGQTSNRLLQSALWRAGMVVGWMLEPWEGREGRGATYTAVLRRPDGD